MFELISANLLSPVILCFVLGIVATLVKSDLELPDAFIVAMSIYLLLAIGLKGGVEISKASFSAMLLPLIVTLVLGMSIPAWSYLILRKLGRFSIEDSAAIAAHYGSCSVVTFIAAGTFLQSVGQPAEGYMPSLVAVLEVPAIVIAILLARVATGKQQKWGPMFHEVLSGRSVLLLIGGLLIGAMVGERGYAEVELLFSKAFKGILCLYLLELGMKAATRLGDLRKAGLFLMLFALVMPLVHGMLGIWLGKAAGLSLGGATILGVLAASASYIAAPAAVRITLPQANPAYYLTTSLGITFPFNLTLGIPLYYGAAKWVFSL